MVENGIKKFILCKSVLKSRHRFFMMFIFSKLLESSSNAMVSASVKHGMVMMMMMMMIVANKNMLQYGSKHMFITLTHLMYS